MMLTSTEPFVYLLLLAIALLVMRKILIICFVALTPVVRILFQAKHSLRKKKQGAVRINQQKSFVKVRMKKHDRPIEAFLKVGDKEIPVIDIRNGKRKDVPSLPKSQSWDKFQTPSWLRKGIKPTFLSESEAPAMAEAFIPG